MLGFNFILSHFFIFFVELLKDQQSFEMQDEGQLLTLYLASSLQGLGSIGLGTALAGVLHRGPHPSVLSFLLGIAKG